VNHRIVEQAPGDGRFCQKPLLRTDTFAFNANRCGFKTRSNGQAKHAGLAYSMAMDQFHKRGATAGQALRSSRIRTKRRTA
jgi:hypothetical protein